MTKQLTIFDIQNQFDDNRANWKPSVVDRHYECNVLAVIPKVVLSPLEDNTKVFNDE